MLPKRGKTVQARRPPRLDKPPKGSFQMSASNAMHDDLDGLRKEMVAPISDCVTLIGALSAIELEYRRRANVAARILEGIMEARTRGPRAVDAGPHNAARELG